MKNILRIIISIFILSTSAYADKVRVFDFTESEMSELKVMMAEVLEKCNGEECK